ncbi:MAG: hypothetical protein ABIP06_14065 [Pyrinomonadaceae bacterium]
MIEFKTAIQALAENKVEFVIIGGFAVKSHGSSYITQDLDFAFLRTTENLEKIVKAFSPFQPRPRDFPVGLPFVFDESTLLNGTNFTFETTIGDLNLLGKVA